MGDEIFIFIACILAIAVFGVSVVLFAAYMRSLRHKEIMRMIDEGKMEVPVSKSPLNGKTLFAAGIIFTMMGLALSLSLYPISYVEAANYPLHFAPWMAIGLLPLFFGLALIVIHQANLKDKEDSD